MENVRLEGKTVIVTGANIGIGKETARGLASTGARVILACRDQQKATVARDDISASTNNPDVVVKILDLASLASIRKFAEDINKNESRVDILVNNAGVLTKIRSETADGFEMSFGVNHLGHFYLTNLLLEKLKSSAPCRIVNVSSMAHELENIDFNDPQLKKGFKPMKAYSQSKVANVLFTVHLAEILKDSGVSVYSLHPGAVETEIFRDYKKNACIMSFIRCVLKCSGMNMVAPEEGALTSLYCCLEPSIAEHSGRYYSDAKEEPASPYSMNKETAKKLWDLSAEMCHL